MRPERRQGGNRFSADRAFDRKQADHLLRHAYAEVKDDDFRLLAGQTWDVISPLFPSMLMYSVGWDAGDIGYRRAQVRGERYLQLLRHLAGDRPTLDQPERFRRDARSRASRVSRPTGRSSKGASRGPRRARTRLPAGHHRAVGPYRQEEFDVTRSAGRPAAAPGPATSTSACRWASGSGSRGNARSAKTWRVPRRHRPGNRSHRPEHHPRRRRLVRSLVRLDLPRSTATSATPSTIPTTMISTPSARGRTTSSTSAT